MSVTLKLADDDAKVIADVLKASATIVVSSGDGVMDDDLIDLLDAACKTNPGSWGSEFLKYQAAAERLGRLSATFITAVKANMSVRR